MSVESLFATFEVAGLAGRTIFGALFGLTVGLMLPKSKLAYAVLLVVPLLMFMYADWWFAENRDRTTSTSTGALGYIFVPLWPSLGALAGYLGAKSIRKWLATR